MYLEVHWAIFGTYGQRFAAWFFACESLLPGAFSWRIKAKYFNNLMGLPLISAKLVFSISGSPLSPINILALFRWGVRIEGMNDFEDRQALLRTGDSVRFFHN
uniref:Uncharacterized protein n=1 Tax=Eimeria tenella TaxID=5802 RepID=H9B9W4_EIMTE|nr:hypothetical protein [Eimeria tenella]